MVLVSEIVGRKYSSYVQIHPRVLLEKAGGEVQDLKHLDTKRSFTIFNNHILKMTTAAIRTKVHKYIDEADSNVLEVVYKLLEVYRQSNVSLLTEEQQKEVLKRSALYKSGKIKGYSLSEVRKRIKQKLGN
jgi:hypothetical protein